MSEVESDLKLWSAPFFIGFWPYFGSDYLFPFAPFSNFSSTCMFLPRNVWQHYKETIVIFINKSKSCVLLLLLIVAALCYILSSLCVFWLLFVSPVCQFLFLFLFCPLSTSPPFIYLLCALFNLVKMVLCVLVLTRVHPNVDKNCSSSK